MELENVALTNDHATLSKISAEQCGFFPEGAYSSKLVGSKTKNRAPLINVGYTIRVKMIRHFISKTLESIISQSKPSLIRIFSIGAGFDNTYHWLSDSYPDLQFEFIEIDTDIVFSRKAEMLAKAYEYSVTKSSHGYQVRENYKLLTFDLNNTNTLLLEDLQKPAVNIWISECVLCYLEREAADKVMSFAASLPNSYFILYEQLISMPLDSFSQCMLAHFVKSNSPLCSSITVDGPAAQQKRFRDCGFTDVDMCFMSEYFYGLASEDESRRILETQLFDEWEELDLFLQHYALVYADNIISKELDAHYESREDKSFMLPISMENKVSENLLNNLLALKFSSTVKYRDMWILTGGRESLSKVSPQLIAFDKQGESLMHSTNKEFARYRHASVVHNGKLFLIGGFSQNQSTLSQSTLVMIQTDKWEVEFSLSESCFDRIGHSAASVGEWIYIIGGFDRKSQRPMPHIRVKWVDNNIVIEEVLPSLPAFRYHTVVSLTDNSLLIFGGLVGRNRFRFHDATVASLATGSVSSMTLNKRDSLMILGGDNVLVDGKKLYGCGKKRTVCFSMGSHCDAPWFLDVSHLSFPSSVPVHADFLPSSDIPYVIRNHPAFVKFSQDLTRQVLLESMGSRKISVHKCSSPKLKFYPEKNFVFETSSLNNVVRLMEHDTEHWYYFRALSEENARKYRADFWHDYPEIASFLDKSAIPIPEERWHSSILRMSTARGLCLWTHFDVMSNFLVQIRGRKRVTLWPPSDLPNLYIQGSSSIADLDDLHKYPKLSRTNPVKVIMQPGDVLFIPALWFHLVECIEEEWSLALNIFWRDLDAECYPKKDLYGNADPLGDPMSLPEPFKSFYLTKKHLI